MNLARILLAIDSSAVPLWLSRECLFPFRLYKFARLASLKS